MSSEIEFVLETYAEAYERLYQRRPMQIQILDENWVLINGARMRIGEVERLTRQIQLEYRGQKQNQRSVINRLINWLTG